MSTTVQVLTVVISGIVMILLDSVYLTSAGGKVFQPLIKKIQGSPLKLNIPGAILAYLGLVLALNMFVLLQPKIPEKKKYLLAFFLGLCIYVVYEGTNLAIFKNWNWTAVSMDSIWGAILFLLTTLVTVKVMNIVSKKLK